MDMADYSIVYLSKSLLSPLLPTYMVIGKNILLICCRQTEKAIFLCCQTEFTTAPVIINATALLQGFRTKSRK